MLRRESRWRAAEDNLLWSIFKAARQLVFGGCRHKKMGWPIWLGGHAYQVCLECGMKRLFDEDKLHGYGPYSHQIRDLLPPEGGRVRGGRQVA